MKKESALILWHFSPPPPLENCFRLLIEQAVKQHGSHENPPPDLAILTLELNAANSDYRAGGCSVYLTLKLAPAGKQHRGFLT